MKTCWKDQINVLEQISAGRVHDGTTRMLSPGTLFCVIDEDVLGGPNRFPGKFLLQNKNYCACLTDEDVSEGLNSSPRKH